MKINLDNNQRLLESSTKASKFLKALSNEYRLMVLCQLSEGEKSVGELCELVGLSPSALSQHLARLRQDDLVKTRRKSQTIFYSLHGDRAPRMMALLYEMFCAEHAENPEAEIASLELEQ